MVYTAQHEMLPRQTPDEMARQRFVLALKRHVMGDLRTGVTTAYEAKCEPEFIEANGRPPETIDEAEDALSLSDHYRFTKSINRASQEMMWQSVAETVYREKDRISEASERILKSNDRLGTLNLDPNFKPEDIYETCNIHLQPEGYCPPDGGQGDVIAGAFYESGGRLYSMGRGMSKGDSKAAAVLKWLAENRPGFKPKRMLDMGCSAGGASAVYPEALPDTEVHACDLGASMLRYAHTRAETMGVAVHYHQMDAAQTSFPDGHFDLIVSHNMFHEISSAKRKEVAKETLRLLAPGGIAIHQDVDLLFRNKKPWEMAERLYDLEHNNEPFWADYALCDFQSELIEAGFSADHVTEGVIPKTSGPGGWYTFRAWKD